MSAPDSVPAGRIVVIGKNSAVWGRIKDRMADRANNLLALGHGDIDGTEFRVTDTVWVFSYARLAERNRALFERLSAKGAGQIIYISTATANVAAITACYRYPSIKAQAEGDARTLMGARVVRIGLVYDNQSELPAGLNAATDLDDLVAAMAASATPGTPTVDLLFRPVERPFRSAVEFGLFKIYGLLMTAFSRSPCLLRPVDLILRAAAMRWYGYLYLSNRLWFPDRAAAV